MLGEVARLVAASVAGSLISYWLYVGLRVLIYLEFGTGDKLSDERFWSGEELPYAWLVGMVIGALFELRRTRISKEE